MAKKQTRNRNIIAAPTKMPRVSWALLFKGNSATDGIGDVSMLFTGAVNGTCVQYIRGTHIGANVATALRIFIGNGRDRSTDTNNALFREIAVDAYSSVGIQQEILIDFGGDRFILPHGYTLFATVSNKLEQGISIVAVGYDL